MAPHQPHLALLHRTAEEHGLAQGRSQRWVGKILPLLPGSLSGLSCSGGDSSLPPARRTFPPEQPSGSQLGPATSLGSREYETHQVCAGQGPAWGGEPPGACGTAPSTAPLWEHCGRTAAVTGSPRSRTTGKSQVKYHFPMPAESQVSLAAAVAMTGRDRWGCTAHPAPWETASPGASAALPGNPGPLVHPCASPHETIK